MSEEKVVYLLVDCSSSMEGYLPDIKKGIKSFMQKLQGYIDQNSDVTYSVYLCFAKGSEPTIAKLDFDEFKTEESEEDQLNHLLKVNDNVTLAEMLEKVFFQIDMVGGGMILVSDGVLSPSENREELFEQIKKFYDNKVPTLSIGFRSQRTQSDNMCVLYQLLDFFSGKQIISDKSDRYHPNFEKAAEIIKNNESYTLRKTTM
jgi:hypothetical protein